MIFVHKCLFLSVSHWYVTAKPIIDMTQGVEHRSTLSIQMYLHLKSYLFLEDECLISPTQCLNVYIILMFFMK